jgi:predicted transcriptional regulator
MRAADSVRRDFVELWGSMGPFWGVPPGTARVYGFLISCAHPATAEEIQEGLAMSRGAVSMACRELRGWGLVHLERKHGSRQLAYRPETDLERALENIVRTRKRREGTRSSPGCENGSPSRGRAERRRAPRAPCAIEALVALADPMAESFLGGSTVQRPGLADGRGRRQARAAARRKA